MYTQVGDRKYYIVDHVRYESEEEYNQIVENHRIQGIAAKALFDANPGGYPVCTNDPPMGPEAQCGSESCDLHNILWLEFDGHTHEQAIGITAIYNSLDSGPSQVAEALGGLDEFSTITEAGHDVPKMQVWYAAHQPLVQYILESRDRELLEFWLTAKYPGRYMPTTVTLHMIMEPDGKGGWQPVLGPDGQLWSLDENEAWGWGFDTPGNITDPDHPSRKRKFARFTFDAGRGY